MEYPQDHKLIYYLQKWTRLSPADEEKILAAFEPIALSKKEKLLHPGETCSYIYFIVQGAMRSYFVDEKGNEHIFQIRLDNSWISDLEGFFTQKPSKYYLQSLEEGFALRVSHEDLEQLYQEVPALERYFRILFQKAYSNALERLNATMWETAQQRYADLLRVHPDIFQRVPLVYIASYLGIAPESLSRIRKKAL